MGLIQEAIRKWKNKKEEIKHMQNVDRWEDIIQERKLSSNERALLKYMEEERQKKIKIALAKFKQKEKDETWRGKKFNPAYAPNMFANEKNIFKGGGSIMKNDTNLYKGGNMFNGKNWKKIY